MTGADIFVDRNVIDNYGGFDPDFLCILKIQKCSIVGLIMVLQI